MWAKQCQVGQGGVQFNEAALDSNLGSGLEVTSRKIIPNKLVSGQKKKAAEKKISNAKKDLKMLLESIMRDE